MARDKGGEEGVSLSFAPLHSRQEGGPALLYSCPQGQLTHNSQVQGYSTVCPGEVQGLLYRVLQLVRSCSSPSLIIMRPGQGRMASLLHPWYHTGDEGQDQLFCDGIFMLAHLQSPTMCGTCSPEYFLTRGRLSSPILMPQDHLSHNA